MAVIPLDLPLPALARDVDVEPARVPDRLGRDRHDEAAGEGHVADVVVGEAVEEVPDGVAVLEHLLRLRDDGGSPGGGPASASAASRR